jgi:hypothetical protein
VGFPGRSVAIITSSKLARDRAECLPNNATEDDQVKEWLAVIGSRISICGEVECEVGRLRITSTISNNGVSRGGAPGARAPPSGHDMNIHHPRVPL